MFACLCGRSLGITAIELAERNPPHSDVNPPVRVLFLIPSLPPPTLARPAPGAEGWSDAFVAFLAACLTKDPALRPDATAALAEPFIVGAGSASGDEGCAVLSALVGAHQRRRAAAKAKPLVAAAAPSSASRSAESAVDADADVAAGGTLPMGARAATHDAPPRATLRGDVTARDIDSANSRGGIGDDGTLLHSGGALVDISDDANAASGGGTLIPSDATIEIVGGTVDLGRHADPCVAVCDASEDGIPAGGGTLPMGISLDRVDDEASRRPMQQIRGDGGTLLSPITAAELALQASTGSGYSWLAGYSDYDLAMRAGAASDADADADAAPALALAPAANPSARCTELHVPCSSAGGDTPQGIADTAAAIPTTAAAPATAVVSATVAAPYASAATGAMTPQTPKTPQPHGTPSRLPASAGSQGRSSSSRWKGIRTTLRRLTTPRVNSRSVSRPTARAPSESSDLVPALLYTDVTLS